MSNPYVEEDVLVCSADRGSAADGRPRHMAWLKHAAAILVSVAREVFDESAYTRFLQRMQMPSSCAAYAAFLRERETLKARRPKCC
jgi:hypothetical protein